MIVSTEKRYLMIHVPKTGGTTLTFLFGQYSDNLRKFPFLRRVLDVNAPNQIRWNFKDSLEYSRILSECQDSISPYLQKHPEGIGFQAVAHHMFSQHSSIDHPVNRDVVATNPGFFKFGFVRNPWDYVFSLFLDKEVGSGMLGQTDPEETRRRLRTPENFRRFVEAGACRRPTHLKMFFKQTQRSYLTDANGTLAVDHVARFERHDEEVKYLCDRLDVAPQQVKNEQQNRSNREGASYREFYDSSARDLVARHFSEDIEAFDYSF